MVSEEKVLVRKQEISCCSFPFAPSSRLAMIPRCLLGGVSAIDRQTDGEQSRVVTHTAARAGNNMLMYSNDSSFDIQRQDPGSFFFPVSKRSGKHIGGAERDKL
jgi:hypothetical protein